MCGMRDAKNNPRNNGIARNFGSGSAVLKNSFGDPLYRESRKVRQRMLITCIALQPLVFSYLVGKSVLNMSSFTTIRSSHIW